jgi:hypothetical protein
MERLSQEAVEPVTLKAPSRELDGLYVYCIGPSAEAGSLGEIGIEGCEVFTVAWKDLCSAVHCCPAEPYRTQDAEVAASWVIAHHRVVDAAWRRWGIVLPLCFNTIINGEPRRDARASLLAWIESEYETLKAKLEALAGKAEYGVQVFWDPKVVARQMVQSDAELRRLEEEVKAKSPGVAYMYRQKLESLLREKTEAVVMAECTTLHSRIAQGVDKVQVDKPKGESGQLRMLMNLSCLVSHTQLPRLEAELNRVSAMGGFSTRLVGPLPPYSFC